MRLTAMCSCDGVLVVTEFCTKWRLLLQGLGTSEGSQTIDCRAAVQTQSW